MTTKSWDDLADLNQVDYTTHKNLLIIDWLLKKKVFNLE
jgi:hypothetical protein